MAKAVGFWIHLGSSVHKDLWRSRFGEEDQEFCPGLLKLEMPSWQSAVTRACRSPELGGKVWM